MSELKLCTVLNYAKLGSVQQAHDVYVGFRSCSV